VSYSLELTPNTELKISALFSLYQYVSEYVCMWVCSDNFMVLLVICELVFAVICIICIVFLYCCFYVYLFLFVLSVLM